MANREITMTTLDSCLRRLRGDDLETHGDQETQFGGWRNASQETHSRALESQRSRTASGVDPSRSPHALGVDAEIACNRVAPASTGCDATHDGTDCRGSDRDAPRHPHRKARTGLRAAVSYDTVSPEKVKRRQRGRFSGPFARLSYVAFRVAFRVACCIVDPSPRSVA